MSAIGPEFYDFIKILDAYDGKLPTSVTSRTNCPDFEFNNATCHLCNGYYGPSFGEPVCVTCHAFLYPDIPQHVPSSYTFSEKTDDRDSGNDEPSEMLYNDRRIKGIPIIPNWTIRHKNQAARNSFGPFVSPLDIDTSPVDDAGRASNSGPSGSNSTPSGSNPVPGPSGSGSNHGNGAKPPDYDKFINPALPIIDDDEPEPVPPSLARSLAALSTPRLPDNLAPGLVEQLPSEVLLCMFSYLDDLSLCACALVCARWWRLVRARVAPCRWRAFAARRWPLYRPLVTIQDWHKKYQSLVESCFCRYCVVQMCAQWQPPYEENAWRRNRLRNELKMLRNDPPEGCAATPLDPKCCHWQAMVTGPAGSPYEGGIFYLYIQVPYSYPMSPPVVRFLTRILHPNVSRHGDLGIDSVHYNWSLALTISKVLISIQSLLTDPYTAVCMEPEVGHMYVNERARFESLARRWTWRYAMHDVCVNS